MKLLRIGINETMTTALATHGNKDNADRVTGRVPAKRMSMRMERAIGRAALVRTTELELDRPCRVWI